MKNRRQTMLPDIPLYFCVYGCAYAFCYSMKGIFIPMSFPRKGSQPASQSFNQSTNHLPHAPHFIVNIHFVIQSFIHLLSNYCCQSRETFCSIKDEYKIN